MIGPRPEIGGLNALGGRPELLHELDLHRMLHLGIPVESEFRSEPHDRRRSDFGSPSEIRHRAETDRLRRLEDHRGDPSFGRRQVGTPLADPFGHAHGRTVLGSHIDHEDRPFRYLSDAID